MIGEMGQEAVIEQRDEAGDFGSAALGGSSPSRRPTLSKHLLSSDGLGYIAAMLCVNVSNFGFHILVSRQLGPSSFGAVAALLNIVTFVSLPLVAIQAAVVVDVANHDGSHVLALRRLFNAALLAGVCIAALLMVGSPAITDFLSLGSIAPVVLLSTWFIAAIPTPILAGASIGQFRFGPVAIASVAGAFVRLALTGILGVLGVGLEGPIIGTIVGCALTLAILAFALRPNLRRYSRKSLRLSRTTIFWTLSVLCGYSALLGVDTVLARHLFGTIEAGRYAAAATAAHIALFVSASVTTLVFPRFLSERDEGAAKRELLIASSLVGAVGLGMAGMLSLAPRLVVEVLFGARYQGITPELRLLSLESALLGVLNLITYFLISRRSLAAFIPWLGVAIVIGESVFLDVDAEQLAWSMLTVVALATIGMGAAATLWRPSGISRSSPVATSPPIHCDASWINSAGDLDLTIVVPYLNPGPRLKPHVSELLEILPRLRP